MSAPPALPSVAAGLAARELDIEQMAEQLRFLNVQAGIALGYIEVGGDVGLSYAVRNIAEHTLALVQADERLTSIRKDRCRLDLPALLAEGGRLAKLGKAPLSMFWRALSDAQRHALGVDRRDSWANIARGSDEERASRDDRSRRNGVAA